MSPVFDFEAQDEPQLLHWSMEPFEELDLEGLYQIMVLRQRVFVVEQNCVYLDADGHDQAAWHLRAQRPCEGWNELMAYARVFAPAEGSYAKIGRVVTAPEARGTGMGRELMRRALQFIAEKWDDPPVGISAQAHLRLFYEGLGFQVYGDPYLEDGIPHLAMAKEQAL